MSITVFSSQFANEIIQDFLEIGVVEINPTHPFRWSSGWFSPIYCDNRLILSYPQVRKKIKSAFLHLINDSYKNIEAIAGVATGGIPYGIMLAEELNLPFVYVRPEAKKHGHKKKVEGNLTKDSSLLVIEDLVSTGGSALAAVATLKDAGAKIVGIASIFNYSFVNTSAIFDNRRLKLISLTDYHYILQYIKNKALYSKAILETLEDWRTHPESWRPIEMPPH